MSRRPDDAPEFDEFDYEPPGGEARDGVSAATFARTAGSVALVLCLIVVAAGGFYWLLADSPEPVVVTPPEPTPAHGPALPPDPSN